MRGRRPGVDRRLALGVLVVAILACSETPGTSSNGPTTSGSGAAGGAGGAGGAVASTSAAGGGALTCDVGSPPSNVPAGECDLLAQDCAAGAFCEPVQTGSDWTTHCTTVGGLKGPKKACVNHDECQGGLRCVFGYCSPVCCPASAEPCEGGTCNVQLGYGPYYATYCSYLAPCVLFRPNACPAGEGCHALNGQGLSVCVTASGSIKQEGESCKYLNECGDMQNCYPPGAPSSVCRYLCKLAGSTAMPGMGGCPAAQTCSDVSIGISGVGVCEP